MSCHKTLHLAIIFKSVAAGIFLERETDDNSSKTNVPDALIFTIYVGPLVILTPRKLSF